MSETDKKEMKMKEIEVEGQPAPADTKSWFEYSWKLQQGVPERLEDAAKFLAVMISLSLTIISTGLGRFKEIVFLPVFIFMKLATKTQRHKVTLKGLSYNESHIMNPLCLSAFVAEFSFVSG